MTNSTRNIERRTREKAGAEEGRGREEVRQQQLYESRNIFRNDCFFFCEFNETLQNGCHISVRGL